MPQAPPSVRFLARRARPGRSGAPEEGGDKEEVEDGDERGGAEETSGDDGEVVRPGENPVEQESEQK